MAFPLVADVITSAMRLQGILASGDAPSATEYVDGLEALNVMLASWSAKRYLLPILVQDEGLVIASGVGSRTIGATGQLVTARPMKIISGFFRDSAGLDHKFLKIGNKAEYDGLQNKSQTGRPSELYYLSTFPNGTIYFNTVTDAAYTLYLQSQKQIGAFAAVSSPWTLPEEYDRAVKFNLAIDIASEFGVPLRPDVVAIARESKLDIKRLRASDQVETLEMPSGVSVSVTNEYFGVQY